MVQIPDSIRPYVNAIQKYHFWILAMLVPLVLLPLLVVAQAGISASIDVRNKAITQTRNELSQITDKSPHPNEKWLKKINSRAQEIDDETFRVWTRLWEAQQPIRQWPDSLGNDFVKAASSLKPGGSLRRQLLERYQEGVRSVVRQTAARMGADLIADTSADADGTRLPRAAGRPAEAVDTPQPTSLLQWSADDQQALFTSFDWPEPPSTGQVLLAQEELWMYGVLCDVIKQVNAVPVGPDPKVVITSANIPIPLVQQLAVGYMAAEDDPGGSRAARIMRFEGAASGGPDMGMPPPDLMAGGESLVRPPHPRFGGVRDGMGMPPGMPPGGPGMDGGQPPASPDDALKNWVYVDFDGKPLTSTQLAAAPTSGVLRLMPFLLRCTIDQRALDPLLVAMTAAPVPIDVRQVRISDVQAAALAAVPGTGSAAGAVSGAIPPAGAAAPGAAARATRRANDINVEVRGTLAIVMPPDKKLLQQTKPPAGGFE